VVEDVREAMGFDRVLFATDYPVPLTWGRSVATVVQEVRENPYLREEEKRQVLGENAARLLGIEVRETPP